MSTDLRGDFVVGETCGGEDGDFLTTRHGVHGVDCGDTSSYHFFGVDLVLLVVVVQNTELIHTRE